MGNIHIVQLGVGQIGRTLIEQILKNRSTIQKRSNLHIEYRAVADSSGIIFNRQGMEDKKLKSIIQVKDEGGSVVDLPQGGKWNPKQVEEELLSVPNSILVDVTDSDKTHDLLIKAVQKGRGLVLSNKIPLSASYNLYQKLIAQRTKYETTVGAGLPVIDTLNKLLDSGDQIFALKGALSGTMNFIFTQIEEGKTFSWAVEKAYKLGYTEPDPRADLSGKDLTRKAIILARTLGYKLEMEDVEVEKLFPPKMANLEKNEFMAGLSAVDEDYAKKLKSGPNEINRYLILVSEDKVKVGVESLSPSSPFATLSGPENLVAIKTERYKEFPLYIRGPGAGPRVTAAGVLTDIISLSKRLKFWFKE